MKQEKDKISKGVLVSIIIGSIIILILIIVSLYLYFHAPKEIKKEKVEGGNINLTYSDDDKSLDLTNLMLLDDAHGIITDSADMYFDFSVVIDLNEASKIDYEISVIPNKTTTVPLSNIKVYLEKLNSGSFVAVNQPQLLKVNKKQTTLGSKIGSMILDKQTIKKTKNLNYRLRAWVDSSSNYQLQPTDVISLKVEVHGKAS